MEIIRPGKSSDAEAIAKVHVIAWRETYAGIVPNDYLDSLSVYCSTYACRVFG